MISNALFKILCEFYKNNLSQDSPNIEIIMKLSKILTNTKNFDQFTDFFKIENESPISKEKENSDSISLEEKFYNLEKKFTNEINKYKNELERYRLETNKNFKKIYMNANEAFSVSDNIFELLSKTEKRDNLKYKLLQIKYENLSQTILIIEYIRDNFEINVLYYYNKLKYEENNLDIKILNLLNKYLEKNTIGKYLDFLNYRKKVLKKNCLKEIPFNNLYKILITPKNNEVSLFLDYLRFLKEKCKEGEHLNENAKEYFEKKIINPKSLINREQNQINIENILQFITNQNKNNKEYFLDLFKKTYINLEEEEEYNDLFVENDIIPNNLTEEEEKN